MMECMIDIETLPSADRQPFIDEATENFRAPSTLTKSQAGADLGITGDDLKYTSADDIKARWEKEMASEKVEEVGDEKWRKTALDGTHGRLLCCGVKVGGNSTVVVYGDPMDESSLLRSIFSEIQNQCSINYPQADKRTPYFIGHNVTFDLKFLFRRAVILGVKPPFPLHFQGRHGKDYYCTMRAWCDYQERISLDNMCHALGIKGKDGFDGSMVYDAWVDEEHEKIKEYCADDADKVAAIYNKLTFAK